MLKKLEKMQNKNVDIYIYFEKVYTLGDFF